MYAILLIYAMTMAAASEDRPTVVVVVGVGGTAEYEERFAEWGRRWERTANAAGAECVMIGFGAAGGELSDHDLLRDCLAERSAASVRPLWLVLIGHGTSDGREGKFNLRGPDLSAAELAQWLQPVERPTAVLNCSSASAPFIPRVSAPGRIVISATRSGQEHFYARFGDFLSSAIGSPTADLDKDGQTSLLEAWLAASQRVEEFYRQEARLATEHALLDDTGDGLGTPASWFRGVRATRRVKDGATLDGARAHQWHLLQGEREKSLSSEQRRRRDELELAVESHRELRPELSDDEYYSGLEKLLVELAEIYEQAEALGDVPPPAAAK